MGEQGGWSRVACPPTKGMDGHISYFFDHPSPMTRLRGSQDGRELLAKFSSCLVGTCEVSQGTNYSKSSTRQPWQRHNLDDGSAILSFTTPGSKKNFVQGGYYSRHWLHTLPYVRPLWSCSWISPKLRPGRLFKELIIYLGFVSKISIDYGGLR